MKKWIAFVVIFFAAISVKAQYTDGPDRYFYDEEFDWRWDVRVRISDGLHSGYLTHREANRLYKRLERIERKEWAFQSDGRYSPWEQDEIWLDVVALNRAIGLELSDWDRRYYGYSGIVITGPLRWYFGPSYDFYRFDRRGYGSIRVGYVPRNYYPVKHVYYTRRNNYTSNWRHSPDRVVTPSRNNSASGSRGYSERNVQPSRSAAPERAGTSGRVMEPSRGTTPERASSSSRTMESSRSTAPERAPSSARTGSSRTESPNMESRSSRSTGSIERSSSRSTSVERNSGSKSPAARSSVESRSSSSKSSEVSRSARKESSAPAKSSSSRSSGGRSRD